MVGKLFIDGTDAYIEYGVFVEQYGYKGIIQMPPFKNVTVTEWDESDGEEADLMNPVLGSRTFGIQFCFIAVAGMGSMCELLSDKAYHIFEFKELSRSYKLRLVSNPSYSSFVRTGKFTLNFADDFPPVVVDENTDISGLDEYTLPLNDKPFDSAPAGFVQNGYSIDNIDFSRFGVYLVEGTMDSLRKAPEVRSNLKSESRENPGVVYDGENVHYKAKDTPLKLFILAEDINDFWSRWNKLFTALLQPELRSLYIDDTLEDYECYYKSNAVTKFDILQNGRIWCEFTVTMRFVNARPSENYLVLSTEDSQVITTEPEEGDIIIRVIYNK